MSRFLSGDFGFNPDMNTISEMNLDDMTFEQNMLETESLQEHENGLGKDEVEKTNESGQFGKYFHIVNIHMVD